MFYRLQHLQTQNTWCNCCQTLEPRLTQGGEYDHASQAAIERGLEDWAQFLLDPGAEANAQGGQYGNVIQAAEFRSLEETLKLLPDAEAEVNTPRGYLAVP